MKHLIYKEWLLSRKTFFTSSIYCILVALIFLLIRISANCGNISYDESMCLSLQRNMYILRYIPCLMFFTIFADHGSIIKDYNCGWMRMCRTTSVSVNTIVASKYLYNLITISVSSILVAIYTAALCFADGSSITWNMINNILIIYFFSLGTAFFMTMQSVLFRKALTVQLVTISILGIIGFVFTTNLLIKIDSLSTKEDIDLFDFIRMEYADFLRNSLPIMIIVAAAVGLICYFTSIQILKRREMP